MTIKAGDLVATGPGSTPTMISDGKRMRVLWMNGHGDGDSNRSFVDRSKTTVRGHPTWKLFAGNVPTPILRGKREPPKYVYLDDRACYAIYSSKFYDKNELKTFWPYDFDNLGNIKANRPNRGRPAYLDAACTTYAKGSLRGVRTEGYEFRGATSGGEQTSPWWVKKEAERAHAKKVEDSTKISLSGAIPVTPSPSTKERAVDPRSYPIGSTVDIYPARSVWKQEDPIGNGRIKFEPPTAPKRYESGPVNGDLTPLGITEKDIQGSPCLNVPAASVWKRPRHMTGDMAGAYAGFDYKGDVEEESADTTPKQKRLKVKHEED
ncbi:hypothetical protein ACET3X_001844 [Alternaria dauci]|uniref:Uncharacterized protein n=1 Tax=Alternaria dauci TaxID=48095 RepID=A0ABR3UYG8_9PLEO